MSRRSYRTFAEDTGAVLSAMTGGTDEDDPLVSGGVPVQVSGGWDPSLERGFLNIFRLRRIDGEDVKVLYTNLDAPEGPALSLENIWAALNRFGIEAPGEWRTAIEADLEADGRGRGEKQSRMGIWDPRGLGERIERKNRAVSGRLKEGIRRFHRGGRLSSKPSVNQALLELGLLSNSGRLRTALTAVLKGEVGE